MRSLDGKSPRWDFVQVMKNRRSSINESKKFIKENNTLDYLNIQMDWKESASGCQYANEMGRCKRVSHQTANFAHWHGTLEAELLERELY